MNLEMEASEIKSVFNDVGRDYIDPPTENPHFKLSPMEENAWAGYPTLFCITNDRKQVELPVWYSHLGLLKLCKHFKFNTILDLGAGDGLVANLLEHIGKDVTTLEPFPSRKPSIPSLKIRMPDIEQPYERITFNKKFDAIWCSHVLEHVRNPGLFLDKLYDDLKCGGVLALTVPYNDFTDCSQTNLVIGHHNRYNQWLLLYQLVCAGFDCRNVSVAVYAGMITVILQKQPNHIPRTDTALFAPRQPQPPSHEEVEWFHEPRLYDFLPFYCQKSVFDNQALRVNWGNPI
ncbi:MAG: class I SAM-dependent methyltransferase [Desulfosarcinaceae bacterium]